jgi:hypothetical protein
VTFSATPPADCTIDWYTDANGGATVTGGYGVTSFSPSITGSTTYYAQARDNATGCVSATRLPVTGSVDDLPVITSQPTNTGTCSGGAATLSVVADNATAYQWKDIDGDDVTTGSGDKTADYTTGALFATTSFWVEVTNGACTVKSEVAAVTVTTLHTAPTAASANARCGAGTVTFSATPPADCTIDWYTDANGGATVTGGYGVTSFTPTIDAPTTYYAQARHIATGCVYATRLAVTAMVHDTVATINGASSNTCPNTTVTLTATATGATSFKWYKDGVLVQSGTTSTYRVSTSGSYTVMGYNNSCPFVMSAVHFVSRYCCSSTTMNALEIYDYTYQSDYIGGSTAGAAYCTDRGFRIATLTEQACMCSENERVYKFAIRSGRPYTTAYNSASAGTHVKAINWNSCDETTISGVCANCGVKCVK